MQHILVLYRVEAASLCGLNAAVGSFASTLVSAYAPSSAGRRPTKVSGDAAASTQLSMGVIICSQRCDPRFQISNMLIGRVLEVLRADRYGLLLLAEGTGQARAVRAGRGSRRRSAV